MAVLLRARRAAVGNRYVAVVNRLRPICDESYSLLHSLLLQSAALRLEMLQYIINGMHLRAEHFSYVVSDLACCFRLYRSSKPPAALQPRKSSLALSVELEYLPALTALQMLCK